MALALGSLRDSFVKGREHKVINIACGLVYVDRNCALHKAKVLLIDFFNSYKCNRSLEEYKGY